MTSWTQLDAFPVVVLRYEDLLDDANRAFAGLLTFLDWELEPLRLAWAIEQTRFESLK